MDMKTLLWEGPHPAVPPNMGHDLTVLWTNEDWETFMRSVRAAFPNAMFLVDLIGTQDSSAEKPELRIVDRFVGREPIRRIKLLFPDPDWRPKYIQVPNSRGKLDWMLDQYWSPRIWFMGLFEEPGSSDWMGMAEDRPVERWYSRSINTSYRRQIDREKTTQAKVLNLARKIGRRLVAVRWPSLADYFAGNGTVKKFWPQGESVFASEAVIRWYREDRYRALGLNVLRSNKAAFSCLPPEDVPDHFWGDVKKPKWVAEAVEKYRAKP